jgi:hypothetical protein
LEVVHQELVGGTLLAAPDGYAPEADENGFFAEGEVEEAAVDGVFVVGARIFVAGNGLELGALR